MAITISKRYQFVKFLGSTDLLLSSLSTDIRNQISIIYGISDGGSGYKSWSPGSVINTLPSLVTYKTYLVVSNTDNPNYVLYSGADIVDTSTSDEISTVFAFETYRGSTNLALSTASFKNYITIIYGVSSDGTGFRSYNPNSAINTLNVLEPNTGYQFVTNGTPFTLWLAPGVSPTPTATNTPTPTITPTQTQTPTLTQTPTQTQTVTVTKTPTNTPTNTVTVTPTTTTTPTPTTSSVPNPNFANYNNQSIFNSVPNISTVGTNGSVSSYGCYDMSGNVGEWVGDSTNFCVRGGNFSSSANDISKYSRIITSATSSDSATGFRIATSGVGGDSLQLGNFVTVANINNSADPDTAYGSVSYLYRIGKFQITNDEYCAFLNSQAKLDTKALYNSLMTNDLERGGIVRGGAAGSFYYVSRLNYGNKPVNYISWIDCARYCNWLHNGGTDSSDTENGAYTINPLGVVVRNSGAKYWIPSENEWYKAAFYDTLTNNYYIYGTQNNATPQSSTTSNAAGDGSFKPISLADPGQLLVAETTKLTVLENNNPSDISTISDLNLTPYGVATGYYRDDAFVSNSAGLIDVISLVDSNKNGWAKVLSLGSGADSRKLLVSPDGSKLYCLNYTDRTISVYNLTGSPKYSTRTILDYRSNGLIYDFCNGEDSDTIYVTCSNGYVLKTVVSSSSISNSLYHGFINQTTSIAYAKNQVYVCLVDNANTIKTRNIITDTDSTISIVGVLGTGSASTVTLVSCVLSSDPYNKCIILSGYNSNLSRGVIYYINPLYNRQLSITYTSTTSLAGIYTHLVSNKDVSYLFMGNRLITFDSSNKFFRSSSIISSTFSNSSIRDVDFRSSLFLPAPSPSPTPTNTTTPTSTPTLTPTLTQTVTITPTLSQTPTATPTPEPILVFSNAMAASVGANDVGQLGNSTYDSSKNFKNIIAPSGNVFNYSIRSSALGSHNIIIDSNKRLWGWGNNDKGQVGPSSWITVSPSGDSLNTNPSTIAYDAVSNKYAVFGLLSNKVDMSTNGTLWSSYTIPTVPVSVNWTASVGWNNNISTGGSAVLTNQYSIFGLINNSNILAAYNNTNNSWSAVTLPVTRNWTHLVQCKNKIFAFASNSNNVLAITPSANSTVSTSDISLGLGSLSVFWKTAAVNNNGSTILAIGYNSRTIVRSIDSGSSWSQVGVTLPVIGLWEKIICSNNRWILIASDLTSVYTSDDNGATWVARDTGVIDPHWNQISIYNNSLILIGSNNNYYLTSTDNGTSWNKRFLQI